MTSEASSGAIRVGIFGASGYAGAELLRLCSATRTCSPSWPPATPRRGRPAADLYPSLAAAYPDLRFADSDPDLADGLDLVFLALPHGASQDIVPLLRKRVGVIVDLAADFRLKDPALYPRWYGEEHRHPELLAEAVFGLPELFRPSLPGATLIAAAGCHVTTAALALAPLVRAGVIEPTGVVVDTITGVSGAGRAPKATSQFCTVDEDVNAYGLLTHRHTPEIEQATGAQVLFTPHLAPMNRGILATCYARPTPRRGRPDPLGVLRRLLRRRAVRRRLGAVTVDQGHARRQHRPPDRPLRRAHRLDHGPRPPSTTWSRGRPARPCSAPTWPSTCPRRPGCRGGGLPVSVTAPAGFPRRRRGRAASSRRQAARPGPGGDRRRPAGRRRRRLHRPTWPRRPRCRSAGPISLASGGQAAAVILNSGNANAATGAAGQVAAVRMCATTAAGLGCRPEEVLVCSTGLIGIPLPDRHGDRRHSDPARRPGRRRRAPGRPAPS